MKRITLLFTFLLTVGLAGMVQAQKNQPSPPATASGEIGDASVEIKYHAPSARGRTVMGELVPYGQVWRTGANNATVITVDSDVQVEGKNLPAGTYSLFTIPGENEWTIIFNKVVEQWGAFNYDQAEDVLRVSVSPMDTDSMVETFEINVVDDGVTMAWENTMVKVSIN